MLRGRLGPMVVGAIVLTACNALSGLDDDFVLAAGPSLPDEAGSDAGGELDADAGQAGDVVVPADASEGGDAGSLPDELCPTGAAWCENWDDKTAQWDRDEIMGGALTVEPGQGVGGSKALHARAIAIGTSRKVARWRQVGTTFPVGTRYWLTFSFRLETVGINYAVIGALQANNTSQTNTEYGLAAYKGCPGACLDENNPAQEGTHPFVGQTPYTPNQWRRAEVIVERTASAYTGTVKVDGKVVDANGATYFGTPQAPSLIEVGIGLFFTGNDLGTADFYIDDVAAGHAP